MKSFIVLLLMVTFSSCIEKWNSPEVGILQGTYEGWFDRSSPNARFAPAAVTITFSGKTFAGQSDKVHYPAICNGTYEATGSVIEFGNKCMWLSDFDRTWILGGKYNFTLIDGVLQMTKVTGDLTDHYTLVQQ